jgi:hypothetical protein
MTDHAPDGRPVPRSHPGRPGRPAEELSLRAAELGPSLLSERIVEKLKMLGHVPAQRTACIGISEVLDEKRIFAGMLMVCLPLCKIHALRLISPRLKD